MDLIFVYVTCATNEEAKKIATQLLEGRLIACANIMPPHESLYRWEGKIENGTEVAMLLKTQAALFEAVKEAILSMHSYDCPCIVGLPLTHADKAYLTWVGEQTT